MRPEQRKLTDKEKSDLASKIVRSEILQKVFSGTNGEKALEVLDVLAGYKDDVFDADPYRHAYNAGVRSVITFIHKAIESDMKQIRKMLKQKSQEK